MRGRHKMKKTFLSPTTTTKDVQWLFLSQTPYIEDLFKERRLTMAKVLLQEYAQDLKLLSLIVMRKNIVYVQEQPKIVKQSCICHKT